MKGSVCLKHENKKIVIILYSAFFAVSHFILTNIFNLANFYVFLSIFWKKLVSQIPNLHQRVMSHQFGGNQ